MKLVHVLGHNPNWNTEIYFEQNVGDEFLITTFTFGNKYRENKRVAQVIDKSMIDLQFYGQKKSGALSKGNLSDFVNFIIYINQFLINYLCICPHKIIR